MSTHHPPQGQQMSDYLKYRGKCKKMVDELVADNPTLTAVRGHYWCPIWNRDEPHWWAVDEKGNIHDPTKRQFPSKGTGTYTPFDGRIICAECGTETTEDEMIIMGNYAVCSDRCALRLVGL